MGLGLGLGLKVEVRARVGVKGGARVTLPAAARLAELRAVGAVDPPLRVAHEE